MRCLWWAVLASGRLCGILPPVRSGLPGEGAAVDGACMIPIVMMASALAAQDVNLTAEDGTSTTSSAWKAALIAA